MLHVLYIIINISRKRIKNLGMSCNLLRVPTFMVLIGGQRIFSFCQIYFLLEECRTFHQDFSHIAQA